MGASMCVPVCMLVSTSTVLLRSRWWVVMSVTLIEANCGHVGMRSPHGWVRSTTFMFSSTYGLDGFGAELVPDVLAEVLVARGGAHGAEAAVERDVDVHELADAAGAGGHDGHAVAEHERFIDGM